MSSRNDQVAEIKKKLNVGRSEFMSQNQLERISEQIDEQDEPSRQRPGEPEFEIIPDFSAEIAPGDEPDIDILRDLQELR